MRHSGIDVPFAKLASQFRRQLCRYYRTKSIGNEFNLGRRRRSGRDGACEQNNQRSKSHEFVEIRVLLSLRRPLRQCQDFQIEVPAVLADDDGAGVIELGHVPHAVEGFHHRDGGIVGVLDVAAGGLLVDV